MLKGFSYMYPVFPILGSISIFMCMISVPAHMKVGNIAVVSLGLWTSIGLLMLVIDSCVWHGNIRNPYPIWGDIVQQYFAMMPLALATCTLCVQYRLWSVARAKTVFITKRERKLRIYTTCFFCFGIPVIIGGPIHYVVQGHRYNVWEDLGPFVETYNTPVSLVLYSMWESLFCFISGIYAIHTLALFLGRRKEMDVALNSGSININKNRYVRLMGLAMVAFVVHFPISAWIFISNCVIYPVSPWISWEDTHSNYGRIMYMTRFMISLDSKLVILLSFSWWSLVLCGFNFFIFFGLGEEATKQYRFWLRLCLRALGINYPKEKVSDRVKRTWLDVLLRRSGRPVLSNSGPNHVIGHFSVDTTETRPSDYDNMSIRSRSDASSCVDVSSANPDSQRHPKKITIGDVHTGQPQLSTVHTGIPNPTQGDVLDEKQDEQLSSLSTELKGDIDLEAQQVSDISIEDQRRKEILERNPELTEEVFF